MASISSGISGSSSAIASLSTLTSTGFYADRSSIASLSSSTSAGLSQTNSALASLSSATSAGIGKTDSAVASLSTTVSTINSKGTKYFHANSEAADSIASGKESIAIGPKSVASGENAVAMGNGATASAKDSMALGTNANASAENSVALGANSIADGSTLKEAAFNPGGTAAGLKPVGEVSVGSSGAERRITNLAAGSAPTDAVNVSQLQGMGDQLNNRITNIGAKAYGGIAAAMAMAEPDHVPGKWTAVEGVGYYQGEVAVAVSLRRTAQNGRWSLLGGASYSPNGGVGARLAVSQVLGKDD